MWIVLAAARAFCIDPDPVQLLQNVSANPLVSYKGRMVSIVRNGKQSRVSDAEIYFQPPSRFRREFFSIQEELEKVVASDGEKEWIYFPSKKSAWEGSASRQKSKNIASADEWRLMGENYLIQLKGSSRVAGREAWVVGIVPKVKGKPVRTLWIDKSQPVILQSKQYNPDGSLAVRAHFTDIQYQPRLSADLFQLEFPSTTVIKKHGLEPDFLSLEEMKKSGMRMPKIPERLPEGFVFESGNALKVSGKEITHLRFTDGSVIISLFESAVPVISNDAAFAWEPQDSAHLGAMGFSTAGKVIRWKSGRRYFVLVGNLETEMLQQIAKSLK